eukprot:g11287.t1
MCVLRRREDLQAEHKRRTRAEAIILRARGGGIRMGDFPSVRDVNGHVERLADHARTWTEKACAVGGSRPALPATTKSILESTFLVCREEVERCLDRRVRGLREFLGNDEPIELIQLSGGNAMNLDTQYVLYECLCRNFQTIVSLEPNRMNELADMVHQRCAGEGASDEDLASRITSGDAWPSFDNLMKSYIRVMVEPLENLYDNLRHAMKLLLEYQQRPQYWGAHKTLQQAEEAANYVYNNERSLVMSLSALRLRIVITYLLHRPMDSKGEPGMDDKKEDKEQCELYISNALKQGLLVSLCRKFLESRDSQDSELRQRVERETVLAFDILLEVMASVHLLEPFMPSQGPVPEDAPAIVVHALSIYCESALGSSHVYADLARALKDWESTPERLEKWALYCLYKSTGGPGWACNKGWNSLFDTGLASLYGVSTAGGRVTKISLGANNLEGHLPLELRNFENLQELSLPGNKLCGKVPAELWSLPCLQVVALHGNRFTETEDI